jgi:hypothetical protein
VPMAGKELAGCVVCGVRLWVVRGDNASRRQYQGDGRGEIGNSYPLRRRGTAIAALVISIRLGDLEELWHMPVSVTMSRCGI